MKKWIVLLSLWICAGVVSSQEILSEANGAYAAEDYPRAVELYERILKESGASAEVYYNLGNAYYRIGKLSSSILNYERALLLSPADGDIRTNLSIASSRTADRIEPLGEFFLTRGWNVVQNAMSIDAWAKLALVSFVLLIGCLVLFFFAARMSLRRLGFYVGLAMLATVIISNVFALNQRRALTDRAGAIVLSPTVTIKSSPGTGGTDLFVLHEGTKVMIKSVIGDWVEIELADGSVGWIGGREIERI